MFVFLTDYDSAWSKVLSLTTFFVIFRGWLEFDVILNFLKKDTHKGHSTIG